MRRSETQDQLIRRLKNTEPARALRRYVDDYGGDVEGMLWDKALGDTRETAAAPVKRLKERRDPEQPKLGYFAKVAADLLPKPPKSRTLMSAGKASDIGKFKGHATANSLKPPGKPSQFFSVNPNRNIRQAMTTFTG